MNTKPVVNQGFKIKLYPTKEQEHKLISFMNARIKSWNYGVEIQDRQLEKEEPLLNLKELKENFSNELKTNPEYFWITEEGVPFHLFHFSLRDVNTAYNRYLKGISNRPKYKSVKDRKKSFVQRNDMKQVNKGKVQVNKIGSIACNQHQLSRVSRLEGKKVLPTLTYDGMDFYYSVSVETAVVNLNTPITEPIGIDVGIRDLMYVSDGTVVRSNLSDITHLLRRRQLLSQKIGRAYSNTSKGNKSNNLKKLEEKLLVVNKQISDYQNTHIYQEIASIIGKNPEYVVMEELKVSNMIKNKNLAKSLNQAKFRFIRDQVAYKCLVHGIPFYLASPKFPSTKLCSGCGSYNDPKTSKTYKCLSCGLVIDRDYNASINLKNYPIK